MEVVDMEVEMATTVDLVMVCDHVYIIYILIISENHVRITYSPI